VSGGCALNGGNQEETRFFEQIVTKASENSA